MNQLTKLDEVEESDSPLMKHAREIRKDKEMQLKLEGIKRDLGIGIYRNLKTLNGKEREVEVESVMTISQ